jgi:ferredoxin
MKVFIDAHDCQGHTQCWMIAPECFELDEIDGTATPVNEVVAHDHEEAVRNAVRSCPEQAISIEE